MEMSDIGWGNVTQKLMVDYHYHVTEVDAFKYRYAVLRDFYVGGEPAMAFSLPIPQDVGAHIGDTVVVGTAKGLIGYQQVLK